MPKKNIKVLLQKDVKNLGNRGQIKTAAPGFVRNFLVPQGLAVIATNKIIDAREADLKQKSDSDARAKSKAENLANKLKNREVVLRVKAGQKGKLFGSVSKDDITDAIRSQHGAEIGPDAIILKNPIKTLGKHLIELRLEQGVKTELTVQIVSQKN